MTSAVDGLKQRFMAMSQPDADGVYRNGAAKRKARTDLAMGNLTQLWNEACEAVSFDVPGNRASASARSVRWHVDRWAPAPTLIWRSSTSRTR